MVSIRPILNILDLYVLCVTVQIYFVKKCRIFTGILHEICPGRLQEWAIAYMRTRHNFQLKYRHLLRGNETFTLCISNQFYKCISSCQSGFIFSCIISNRMAFCSNLRRNLQNLKMILQYYLFRIFVDNQYIIRQNSCKLMTFIRHCKISQVSFAKKILASILIFLMLQECISQKSYIEIMQRNSKY